MREHDGTAAPPAAPDELSITRISGDGCDDVGWILAAAGKRGNRVVEGRSALGCGFGRAHEAPVGVVLVRLSDQVTPAMPCGSGLPLMKGSMRVMKSLRRSWWTQWPACSKRATVALLKCWMRPSSRGSDAQLSLP